MRSAGIVLAGGRSTRMGTPKAWLEWHGSTLLRRVAGIVGRATGGLLVVVRAPGQSLPALPEDVEVVDDAHEGRGPLEGIAAGLAALDGRAETAYVSCIDVPLLHPAFVRRVLEGLAERDDLAVPHVGGHRHPLSAAYRIGVRPLVDELLAADRMKPAVLLERCRVSWLDAEELLSERALVAADPHLDSVRNLNEPADYRSARALPAPTVRVERSGIPRARSHVQAALGATTIAQAARGAGVTLDRNVAAAVNGDRISPDPEFPLVAGDGVHFFPANGGGVDRSV